MMDKTFCFLLSCAVSTIISNPTLAAEQHGIQEPPKKRPRSSIADVPQVEPSLRDYLHGKENTLVPEQYPSEQARIAAQLAAEEEGILPAEDSDDHEE